MKIVWLVTSLIVLGVGLIGTIVPLLPGVALIFCAYLIWGLASHWTDYGLTTLTVVGVLTLFTYFMDYYAGAIGARKFGASAAGTWGAVVGAILGFILLNLPGLIVGPFLGAVLGELFVGRSQSDAWKAGWGAFVGFLAGSLFRILIGIILTLMFLYFLIT